MFVTNWISTTNIQKISEITNFFRHYFLSRTEVIIIKKLENIWQSRFLLRNLRCVKSAMAVSVTKSNRESDAILR